MRRSLLPGALSAVVAMLFTACVVPPPAGMPTPPVAGVVPADARALRYGASAPEVFNNPELRHKVRALFGPDWSPAPQGGSQIAFGAQAFFPGTSSLRLLRIDGQDYIAVTGCVPSSCPTHRGLMLIRQDGQQLYARLDEGGFSHYYVHGPDATVGPVSMAFIDGAWRTIQSLERA